MSERIKDKIEEIEKYLQQLEEITPLNLREYTEDFKTKSACERHAEIIIEAIVDLAFLFIKEKKMKIPEDDTESFFILAENRVISSDLAQRLKEAKGMRNMLAHEYGKVDDKIVFNAIKEELIDDVNEFVTKIEKGLR